MVPPTTSGDIGDGTDQLCREIPLEGSERARPDVEEKRPVSKTSMVELVDSTPGELLAE
jgi:hypothetical protein